MLADQYASAAGFRISKSVAILACPMEKKKSENCSRSELATKISGKEIKSGIYVRMERRHDQERKEIFSSKEPKNFMQERVFSPQY